MARARPISHRLLVAGWLCLPFAAGAQALDPAVEAMLREGIAQRVAGRDEAAVARFEAAYTAQRAPITAGQLALALQAMGRWVEADRFMREALAAPDDDWVRRHRRELDEAHAIVRRNVGALEVLGGPAGAGVRVDGVEVGRLPLAQPLRLRAGAVTLEVRADAHFPITRQVTVLGGELSRELVTLVPHPAAPMPPGRGEPVASVVVVPVPSRADAGARPEPTAPVSTWIVGGLGLALVTGGGVVLGLRESSAERFNANCPNLAEVPRDAQRGSCRDEVALGERLVVGAVVSLSAGGIALGMAAALALWPRRNDPRAANWSCGPGVAGAACVVRF